MLSSCVCPSIRLSVRHNTQAGTVPKRLSLGSRKQRHTIAQGLHQFTGAKGHGVIPTESPQTGALSLPALRSISVTHAFRSVPAPRPPAPRSAPALPYFITSAHRSARAQPIFGRSRAPAKIARTVKYRRWT